MSDDLDARMKAAGMMSIDEMMARNSAGKFSAHAGVRELADFERWVIQQRREFMEMQARMTLDGALDEERNEMFEWVVAHSAVFGAVLANFRQATGRAP